MLFCVDVYTKQKRRNSLLIFLIYNEGDEMLEPVIISIKILFIVAGFGLIAYIITTIIPNNDVLALSIIVILEIIYGYLVLWYII